MKNILFIAILTLPIIASAQKKESWMKRSREAQRKESAEAWRSHRHVQGEPGTTATYLQKSGSMLIGGTVCELLGGGLIGVGASNDTQVATYAGAGVAVVGLILQIVGYSDLIQAGRVSASGKGISFAF